MNIIINLFYIRLLVIYIVLQEIFLQRKAMSYSDLESFLASIHPFDLLSQNELKKLTKGTEIAYYPKESQLLSQESSAEKLFIIIKGEVASRLEESSNVRIFHIKDSFDADAILSGKSPYNYIALEDTIVYEIEKNIFKSLFKSNSAFQKFYLMDIAQRIKYMQQQESSKQINIFLTTNVSDIYLHSPCIVSAETALKDAIESSINLNRSEIIVESNNNSYGIITDSDIKKMLLNTDFNLDTKAGELATYPLITIERDDYIFNAYLLLIKKNIKRLAVIEKNRVVGILEQIDILSYFANYSHLITVKIEKAESLMELKSISLEYIEIVKRLYQQGVKPRYISKLISEINRKTFERLFNMLMPKELQNSCALLVMGSEGRKEQIIRTDQDNALIIKEGVDAETFTPYMNEFSKWLVEFGYPPCPGDIMVSNRYWRRSVQEYKALIDKWIEYPDEQHFMEFSIFFDAHTVAGETKLLSDVKEYILNRFDNRNDLYMAHFAKLTLLFETPTGLLSTLFGRNRHIDIKKAGLFPVVQGVRALSLKTRIEQNSTIARIKELKKLEVIDKDLAKELIEAFDVLQYLRLNRQLEAIEVPKSPDNMIDIANLSKLQRDLLKDSLEIVEKFRNFIMRYFELDRLPI